MLIGVASSGKLGISLHPNVNTGNSLTSIHDIGFVSNRSLKGETRRDEVAVKSGHAGARADHNARRVFVVGDNHALTLHVLTEKQGRRISDDGTERDERRR